MKVDLDYLRQLLEAFESAERPYVALNELHQAFDEAEGLDRFVFHMELLQDKAFVRRMDGYAGYGLIRATLDTKLWERNEVLLRMTADAHAFLEALLNQDIWAQLKRDCKDGSLETIIYVGKALLRNYLDNKIGKPSGLGG